MDLLETAAFFVSSLTRLPVTVYHKEPDILADFEKRYCFNANVQELFTARGMADFFEKRSEAYIYDIADCLDIRATVLCVEGNWLILGPFVETEWEERRAKRVLIKQGGFATDLLSYKMYRCQFPILPQNYVHRLAALILEYIGEKDDLREVHTVYTHKDQGNPKFEIQEAYEDFQVVRYRYYLEERFIEAISAGQAKEALELLFEMKKIAGGLRFYSDDMKDQIAGAAIIRTQVRLAAKKAGMTPVAIDSISQEFAQQMQHVVSQKALGNLIEQTILRFCSEIREIRKNNYSVYVRKAVDYINSNLSSPITSAELSEVAGVTQSYFVQVFGRETGMTVKQYIAKRRCEIASELLLDSKLSIQEIAAYVGYTDNNYFTKVFKSHTGVSPQDYRRNYSARA